MTRGTMKRNHKPLLTSAAIFAAANYSTAKLRPPDWPMSGCRAPTWPSTCRPEPIHNH
jgi:hypothetical protein